MVKDDNGWNEYEKLVLSSLERLEKQAEDARTEISGMRTELALIKQKASLWGAVSGSVSAVLTIGGAWIKSKVAP